MEGLLQMASGLDYIHSKHIVHQNLKPENILLSATRPVHFKLSEFIPSRLKTEESKVWMAPEILGVIDQDCCDLDTGVVSDALATALSDVWSLGCVFFYFLSRGEHPFGEKNTVRIFNILEGNPYLLTELTPYSDHTWKLSLVAEMIAQVPNQRSPLIDTKKQLELVVSYINDLNESQTLPESLTEDGSSLLHFAAQLKSKTAPLLMAEFLSRSSDINVRDKHGRTPLDVVTTNRSPWASVLTRQLQRRGGRYSHQVDQVDQVDQVNQPSLSALCASDLKEQLLENVRNVCIKDSEGYEWV